MRTRQTSMHVDRYRKTKTILISYQCRSTWARSRRRACRVRGKEQTWPHNAAVTQIAIHTCVCTRAQCALGNTSPPYSLEHAHIARERARAHPLTSAWRAAVSRQFQSRFRPFLWRPPPTAPRSTSLCPSFWTGLLPFHWRAC